MGAIGEDGIRIINDEIVGMAHHLRVRSRDSRGGKEIGDPDNLGAAIENGAGVARFGSRRDRKGPGRPGASGQLGEHLLDVGELVALGSRPLRVLEAPRQTIPLGVSTQRPLATQPLHEAERVQTTD